MSPPRNPSRDTSRARASLSPHLGVAPTLGSSYFASVPLTPPSRPLSGFCPNSPWKLEQFLGVDWNGATWGSSKFGHGQVGNGGLSFRYRHVLYNCIDWLDDGTQHGSSGNRSVLWDWRWQRNEDAMFCKCMSGKGNRGGDARIEDWRPAWRPETRLHYKVASMCLANKWSQFCWQQDVLLPTSGANLVGEPMCLATTIWPPRHLPLDRILRAVRGGGRSRAGAHTTGRPTPHRLVCL